MHLPNFPDRAPSRKLAEWWRRVRAKRKSLDELARFGGGLERLARDLNLSAWDLRAVVAKWPTGGDLLGRRLTMLQLDPATFSSGQSAAVRDLERVCSLCDSKARCEHDLAGRAPNPEWRDYCLNVPTLDALQRETIPGSPPSG